MNLITIMKNFPSQESCITHLEKIRWGDNPKCPRPGCESNRVARKQDRGRIGEWNCHQCKSTFNVMTGTMFQGTRIELHKWFLAISLIVNAKKSLSSYQLARDLDLTQQTALYMQQRIRVEMGRKSSPLLQGIIEADEAYIGGKPRKRNKRRDDEPTNKRGRGTKKTPILGAVERGGNVTARVQTDLSGTGIIRFLRGKINPEESKLITDEYGAYRAIRPYIPHEVINHQVAYVDGDIHTNTIEGFWSLLKRAWYGSHHHYAKKFTPLYVIEACWKYNHRNIQNGFDVFLKSCFA